MWVFRYVLKYLAELGLMLGRKYLLGQASRLKISGFPSYTAEKCSHTIHLEAPAMNLSGDVTQGNGEYILLLEKHIHLPPQYRRCRLLRGSTWAKLQTYRIID